MLAFYSSMFLFNTSTWCCSLTSIHSSGGDKRIPRAWLHAQWLSGNLNRCYTWAARGSLGGWWPWKSRASSLKECCWNTACQLWHSEEMVLCASCGHCCDLWSGGTEEINLSNGQLLKCQKAMSKEGMTGCLPATYAEEHPGAGSRKYHPQLAFWFHKGRLAGLRPLWVWWGRCMWQVLGLGSECGLKWGGRFVSGGHVPCNN